MKSFAVDILFGIGLMAIVALSITILNQYRQTLGVSTRDVETSLKIVALTFDDGPSETTTQILDILKQKEVPATFFLVGENIEQHPELVQTIYFSGHQIGNHSYSHPAMFLMNQSDIVLEFAQTEELLYELIGIRPQIIRIPYGWYHQLNMWQLLETKYYHIIDWNVDPMDWKHKSPEKIISTVINDVEPGSIILLHDGPPEVDRSATVEALPDIIDRLHQQGYQFVTIDQLIELDQNHLLHKKKGTHE